MTAMDLSADDFLTAAEATRGLGHLAFLQGDATLLPFPDRTFDAVSLTRYSSPGQTQSPC